MGVVAFRNVNLFMTPKFNYLIDLELRRGITIIGDNNTQSTMICTYLL